MPGRRPVAQAVAAAFAPIGVTQVEIMPWPGDIESGDGLLSVVAAPDGA
jgi:hypothetical protein